jgi:hypothetical protein
LRTCRLHMARSSRFVARVSIGSEEWRRAWRRESRLLARVRRAAWRRGGARWLSLSARGRSPARTPTACRYERSPPRPGSARHGYTRVASSRSSAPRQEAHLVTLHNAGTHTSAELAELFSVARSTVYRAIQRAS